MLSFFRSVIQEASHTTHCSQYVLWNQCTADHFARVDCLSKWRKVYLILARLGWNCGIPPVADSLLWSPSLTKGTRSGCPIKCNTFLLQASDNINEGDLKTASSKLRIIYCPSSVMSRAKDWNKPTQKWSLQTPAHFFCLEHGSVDW